MCTAGDGHAFNLFFYPGALQTGIGKAKLARGKHRTARVALSTQELAGPQLLPAARAAGCESYTEIGG
jgi:hypothetical protein